LIAGVAVTGAAEVVGCNVAEVLHEGYKAGGGAATLGDEYPASGVYDAVALLNKGMVVGDIFERIDNDE